MTIFSFTELHILKLRWSILCYVHFITKKIYFLVFLVLWHLHRSYFIENSCLNGPCMTWHQVCVCQNRLPLWGSSWPESHVLTPLVPNLTPSLPTSRSSPGCVVKITPHLLRKVLYSVGQTLRDPAQHRCHQKCPRVKNEDCRLVGNPTCLCPWPEHPEVHSAWLLQRHHWN